MERRSRGKEGGGEGLGLVWVWSGLVWSGLGLVWVWSGLVWSGLGLGLGLGLGQKIKAEGRTVYSLLFYNQLLILTN